MKQLKGLYLELPKCGHTYGLSAINDNVVYDQLSVWFYDNSNTYKIFRQSDSQFSVKENKSYLYIEFLGENLNDDTALSLALKIAKELELKIVDII